MSIDIDRWTEVPRVIGRLRFYKRCPGLRQKMSKDTEMRTVDPRKMQSRMGFICDSFKGAWPRIGV